MAEVLRMSTARDCRRRGVATRLLHGLLDDARRRGLRRIVLETSAGWTGARSLYERNGFTFDREQDGEYGPDAYYWLDLGDSASAARRAMRTYRERYLRNAQ